MYLKCFCKGNTNSDCEWLSVPGRNILTKTNSAEIVLKPSRKAVLSPKCTNDKALIDKRVRYVIALMLTIDTVFSHLMNLSIILT